MREGKVVAVSVAGEPGVKKSPCVRATLVAGHGVLGDAHAGPWHRQVSLLAVESAAKIRARGVEVGPGDFAENLTVAGIDIAALSVGTRIRAGEAVLEVSQVGKACHEGCAISRRAGDCVMPREGIFARVVQGGTVSPGDAVVVRAGEDDRG